MKNKLLTTFILCTGIAVAQTQEKKAVVRVKKVENINGVERITDTTYTVDNPDDFKWEEEIKLPEGSEIKPGEGKHMKVIVRQEGDGKEEIRIESGDSTLDREIENAIREAGVNGETDGKKIVIINKTEESGTENNEKKVSKIVVLRNSCEDPSEEELTRLGIKKSELGNVIEANDMKMFPNPNDGKFTLSFNIKGKGNVDVIIYNAEGKVVYKDNLPNFTGNYSKEIDLSTKEKGGYFVRVQQGKSSQVKKIIVGQ
jgi:hypothetical protein